jgi:cytochrome c oxidase assembly protein subunit 15
MLFQLAVTGLLVALLPAAIVWVSADPDKFRKLVWVTLFLTFDLIMFGAFTRLTDSGLGCPDWPGCYGQANPFQAMDQIRAAEAALPTGPVTVVKAWIEMIHRYLAMAVGVLIIALMVSAWRSWRQARRARQNQPREREPGLPTLLFVFVCIQGAFGAWTVTLKLQPAIVTIHLVLGMTLLGMLAWLAARHKAQPAANPAAERLVFPATLAMAILAIQIALGGWVSTNYAALACLDYPLCQGAVIPPMDFSNGFSLWRELGQTADGEYLPFPALTAIQWTHRTFALVVLASVGWLACRANRVAGLQTLARALAAALLLQFLLGISTVYLNWPLSIAVLHNGGAALLVLLLTMLNYRIRHMTMPPLASAPRPFPRTAAATRP